MRDLLLNVNYQNMHGYFITVFGETNELKIILSFSFTKRAALDCQI